MAVAECRGTMLRKVLERQGRSVTWLATKTGYSRSYVSSVLHDHQWMTDEFQDRALHALGQAASIRDLYHGRVIKVPENIYRNAARLPALDVELTYEQAWKRAWVEENGEAALALAAERAWRLEIAAEVLA